MLAQGFHLLQQQVNDLHQQQYELQAARKRLRDARRQLCSQRKHVAQFALLVRPIARYQQRTDYAFLCARVQELTHAGWSLEAIAHQLEADGYPPLRRTQGWSPVNVQTLRRQLGLGNTHRHGQSREALGPDEWWAREVAERLAVSQSSVCYWIERGVVRARKECSGLQRWIVWADATELERLRAYRHRDIAAEHRRRWTALPSTSDNQNGATP